MSVINKREFFLIWAKQTILASGKVLVGTGRATGSALGISRSTTAFAVQPGGGVDIAVRRNVAIRLQGDYRALRDEGETFGEFRFAAGVVFGFGMRS